MDCAILVGVVGRWLVMRHVFVCCGLTVAYLPEPIALPAVVVVEGYAKSVALASDTVSRVWVDMTSRVIGIGVFYRHSMIRVINPKSALVLDLFNYQ